MSVTVEDIPAEVMELAQEVDDLRDELTARTAERDQLRVLLLGMSDTIDALRRASHVRDIAAVRDGYDRGYHDGYLRGTRELQDEWPAIVGRLADPPQAETEARRWTVRGDARDRETFAAPHPADDESECLRAARAACWSTGVFRPPSEYPMRSDES